jgi:cyclophilin family peptidyl-prolyl cis-trans isomerase
MSSLEKDLCDRHSKAPDEPHSTMCSEIDELYENGANIKDDPAKKSNKRGRVVFATSGPDTRSTQVFVNLADNTFLDDQVSLPFAYAHSHAFCSGALLEVILPRGFH